MLFTLCAAQFMLILDIVIVNVAIPSMRADLAIADSRLYLVSVVYTLTFGSLLIVAGRAGDVVERFRVLLTGLILFTLASAVTGLAINEWMLFIGRALLAVFILVERKHEAPILRMALLKQHTIGVGNVLLLLNSGALTAGCNC